MKKILLTTSLFLSLVAVHAQTILTENFEGTGIPAGWTQQTLATDGGFKFGINTALQSASFPIPAHTKMACTNDDACNCNKSNDKLITPSLDFSTYSNVYLSFEVFFGGLTYLGITEIATVDVSTNGGASWTTVQTLTGNTAWNLLTVDLSAYAGQANVQVAFHYNDGGGWLYGYAIDNVLIFVPAAFDASFQSITPALGSPNAYAVVSGNVTIGGVLYNAGMNAITSFDAKYNDGSNTFSSTISASIPSLGYYTFSISTPYTIPTLGAHPITAWVELSGDNNHANDTMNTSITGVAFLPVHKVVVEEATGTWCGWCPRGTVYMDSLSTQYPNSTVLIAVHNADPMVHAPYDNGVGTLIAGYPSILINREILDDPSNAFVQYADHINDFGFADIAISGSFNSSTRLATVDLSAHFATDLSGDYRLAAVFTENNVTGTTSAYNQVNYYSFQSNNIPLVGAGHNWQTEPNPVLAANLEYDFVARTIQGGFTGQAGSLPATMTANSTYNYTFTYTIPATYNESNMNVHALLFDVANNRILNASSANVNQLSGVEDLTTEGVAFSVFPNPTSGDVYININAANLENVNVTITNVLGEVIAESKDNTARNMKFDLSAQSNGLYFVAVTSENGKTIKKVMLDK